MNLLLGRSLRLSLDNNGKIENAKFGDKLTLYDLAHPEVLADYLNSNPKSYEWENHIKIGDEYGEPVKHTVIIRESDSLGDLLLKAEKNMGKRGFDKLVRNTIENNEWWKEEVCKAGFVGDDLKVQTCEIYDHTKKMTNKIMKDLKTSGKIEKMREKFTEKFNKCLEDEKVFERDYGKGYVVMSCLESASEWIIEDLQDYAIDEVAKAEGWEWEE